MSDTEDRPTGLSQWDRNDEVARTLYAEYNARFLSDNGRIWTTAATMVPLSLGSFALLASIKHPSRAQVIALPLIGLCLMTFWLAIAAKHRVFQEAALQNVGHRPYCGRAGDSFLARRHLHIGYTTKPA
jgi:hypothetical protein